MTMPPPIPRRLLGPAAQQQDLEQTAMLAAAMAGKKTASDILKPQRQIGQPPPMPMAAMGGMPQAPGAPPAMPPLPPGGMPMPPMPAPGLGTAGAASPLAAPAPALPNAPAPGGMGLSPAPMPPMGGAPVGAMPPGPAMSPPPMMAAGGVMPADRNPPGIQLLDGVLSAPELFQRFLQFRQGGGDGVSAGAGGGLDSGMLPGGMGGGAEAVLGEESPPIFGPEDVGDDGFLAGSRADGGDFGGSSGSGSVLSSDAGGAGLEVGGLDDDTDLDDARSGSPPPPVFARWLKEAAPTSDSPLARAMGQAFAQSPDELTAIWNALRDVSEEEGAEDELPEPVLRMLGKKVTTSGAT
jgi:hypothetical protein